MCKEKRGVGFDEYVNDGGDRVSVCVLRLLWVY